MARQALGTKQQTDNKSVFSSVGLSGQPARRTGGSSGRGGPSDRHAGKHNPGGRGLRVHAARGGRLPHVLLRRRR